MGAKAQQASRPGFPTWCDLYAPPPPRAQGKAGVGVGVPCEPVVSHPLRATDQKDQRLLRLQTPVGTLGDF